LSGPQVERDKSTERHNVLTTKIDKNGKKITQKNRTGTGHPESHSVTPEERGGRGGQLPTRGAKRGNRSRPKKKQKNRLRDRRLFQKRVTYILS